MEDPELEDSELEHELEDPELLEHELEDAGSTGHPELQVITTTEQNKPMTKIIITNNSNSSEAG